MGCLTISATRTGGLSIITRRVDDLTVDVERRDILGVSVAPSFGISVSCHRIGAMSASVGLICTTSELRYLRVAPEDVQWVTEWISATYDVESNTDWDVN